MPLIASSIMSKKLAAGSKNIVLDVKYGSGAFMKTPEDAEGLAKEMVKIGKACARNTTALITNMSRPLGNNIGNALEVQEALEVLNGEGPEDLKEVCLALATQLVSVTKGISSEAARRLTEDALYTKKALAKFKEWIVAQGSVTPDPVFKKADHSYEITAPCDGYILSADAEKIGVCAVILGAGREKKDDTIDMSAGIILNKKTGDKINKGDLLATLYSCNKSSFENAEKRFLEALEFSENEPPKEPLIYKVIE
jgi:pyrimidine-nucleoside phosphorylase